MENIETRKTGKKKTRRKRRRRKGTKIKIKRPPQRTRGLRFNLIVTTRRSSIKNIAREIKIKTKTKTVSQRKRNGSCSFMVTVETCLFATVFLLRELGNSNLFKSCAGGLEMKKKELGAN